MTGQDIYSTRTHTHTHLQADKNTSLVGEREAGYLLTNRHFVVVVAGAGAGVFRGSGRRERELSEKRARKNGKISKIQGEKQITMRENYTHIYLWVKILCTW